MRFFPLAAVVVMVCGGCSLVRENETRQQEIWLRQAGFRVLKADTPEKAASLLKMTPGRIESTAQGNSVIYRYADPAGGLLFLGGPREFAAYQRIAEATKARRSANLAQITPGGGRVTGPLVW